MDRLKKELQKLRRENSRLKKNLNRIEDDQIDDLYEDDEQPREEKVNSKQAEHFGEPCGGACKKCSKDTRIVELGQYKYQWCDYCSHRQKIK
jgi:hypothetical protein